MKFSKENKSCRICKFVKALKFVEALYLFACRLKSSILMTSISTKHSNYVQD